MEVIVQWVRTSWTKQSRGEPGAARRNAAPAAFPLPPVRPPFVHQVLMGEHDGFQPHFTVHEGLPGTGPDSGVLLNEEHYRFAAAHGGEWTYRLDTLNVAHGPAHVDLFLGPPSHRVDELAILR